MVRHLFKLIWNKKKQNFLLISEILVSFIVIFTVFTLLVFFYDNYKQPIGFNYENVWVVKFSNPENIKSKDSITAFYESVESRLHAIPQIKYASFHSGNYPFSSNTNNNNVTYGKLNTVSNFYVTQDSYPDVLKLKMKAGRWFNKADAAHKDKPVVINESLKQELFKSENAIGKKMGQSPDVLEVVGVVEDFKDKGDFQAHKSGIFRRMDTTNYNFINILLINVTPNSGDNFESNLFKILSNTLGSSIEIIHLSTQKDAINSATLIPMIILFIVAGFLIINVGLGLFGVLWYNISKRKAEIGLRRAVGASGKSVTWQLIGEAMVVATFSLIIGSFFAVQFPLLNVFDLSSSTYFIALGLSIVFIYLLVLICSLYPGRQAAAIYPAVALHED